MQQTKKQTRQKRLFHHEQKPHFLVAWMTEVKMMMTWITTKMTGVEVMMTGITAKMTGVEMTLCGRRRRRSSS